MEKITKGNLKIILLHGWILQHICRKILTISSYFSKEEARDRTLLNLFCESSVNPVPKTP